MNLKHFTKRIDHQDFFRKLTLGEYFTYPEYFTSNEIKEIAEQLGYKVSEGGYKLYGNSTMKVIKLK